MNEKKRLIKNTGIIAIGNISTKLVSFLLLPLYTYLLSKEEYGIVDYIMSVSLFLVPFISLLLDEAIFRFLIDCKNKKEKSEIISLTFIVISISSFIFMSILIIILKIISYKYSFFLVMYILSSLVSIMMNSLLRGLGKIELFAVYNFCTSIGSIVLNILFILVFRLGISGMLSSTIISQIFVTIIFSIKIKIWTYIRINNVNVLLVKEMIKYSLPLIPNKISWSIINLSDRLIIMNMINSGASGLYAISYKFPSIMDTIYGFFYQSWKESSARILQYDNKDMLFNEVYSYLKKLMFSLVIGMIAFMPFVFAVLINEQYFKAIYYTPILLIATYFSNISGFYGGIFTAYKDTMIMGTTTIIAAIINFVLNLILIYRYGLYAAAFSTLIADVVICSYRKFKVQKYIKLKRNTVDFIVSTVVLVVILILFYSMNLVSQLIGAIIAVVFALYENKDILIILTKKLMCKFRR